MVVGSTRVARADAWRRRGRTPLLPSTARDLRVIGTYFPDEVPDSCGVPAGTTMPGGTLYDGVTLVDVFPPAGSNVITLTEPDVAHVGKRFWGQVYIAASATNLRFNACATMGPPAGSMKSAAIEGQSANLRGAVFTDCDIRIPTERRDPWLNCISGENFTLRRCHLTGGSDGAGITMPNYPVIIEGCWIHDGYWESWPAGTAGKPTFSDNQTHNDGIQLMRGKGHRVRGNTIGGPRVDGAIVDRKLSDDFNNSGILVQQEVSSSTVDRLTDVIVEKNKIQGGRAALNLSLKFSNDLSGVIVRDNIFPVQTWTPPTYYILRYTGTAPVLSNNLRRYADGTTDAAPIGTL